MSNIQLHHHLYFLPDSLKIEVALFIEDLLKKKEIDLESSPVEKRQFGFLKGKITMLPNFDDPLEEFEEYM
jgi:hypothetical protein